MPVLPIRTFGDPVLREPGREVEVFDDALRRLAEDMLETMYEAPGVGLAAPQVGRSIRLVVIDVGEGPLRLVNPKLSEHEGEQDGEEGCLSIPGVYFPVKRAMKVRCDAKDPSGKDVTVRGEGLLARALQHEVDHIDGVLFVDRLDPENRREALRMLREQQLGFANVAPDPTRAL